MSVASLPWRFGFLVHDSTASVPDALNDWTFMSVGGLHVHVHPEANIQTVVRGGTTALLLGDAFVCHGRQSVDNVLLKLLEQESWEALDSLSGRFALFMVTAGACEVVADAFGARSVYYRLGERVGVSSHSSLLAQAFGDTVDHSAKAFIGLPEYRQRGTGYLPGDATMYASIKCLIPNNVFSSRSQSCTRFWPRGPVAQTTVEEFLRICDEYFENFARFLKGRYRPLLGLTGGVDARGIIAGLRGFGIPMQLVTWTGNRLPQNEVPVVAQMVEHLACPHVYLDPSSEISDDRLLEVRDAANSATGFCRGRSGLTAQMGKVAAERDVFIRGYGGEIVRGFYNRHGSRMSGDMGDDFFALYKTKRVAEPSPQFEEFARSAIEGYIERANYSAPIFNVDLRDLYYWEQRMGSWGANMHNEMDPAVYSMTGLNSRKIYQAAFGLPEKERFGTSIMLRITSRYDPEFAGMVVRS